MKTRVGIPIALVIPIVCTALSANAGTLTEFGLGFGVVYTQTGPSTVDLWGGVLSVYVSTLGAGDFASGALTYCGGGAGCPLPLTPIFGGFMGGGSSPTLSALEAAFPFGDYTVTLSGPGTASTTIDHSQDLFPADIPMLAPAAYDALQGLDTASGITLDFNSFSPDPSATFARTDLIISPTSPGSSFQNFGLTTTSLFVPANTLLPSTSYEWTLTFIEGISSPDSNGVDDEQYFYVNTEGTFTTGASTPEPGTVVLMSLGLALCVFRVKRLGR
jgi:hypothetical protein